ncbi:hypothetical protein Tco_0644665, partial [Tanacetum coccineum]
MPSHRPAAYSPKVVILNPFVEIPSGEIKEHIEVLSLLWGNRLSIPDGSLPLSRTPDVASFKKVEEISEVEIRLLALVQKIENGARTETFAFCFDIGEKSSGSTTSHSDHSLPEYESFCFDVDHIKEKSSGSTTSHSDLSLPEYESLHFDLSIGPFPPTDRSDFYHEEFADELAHIISPPEYDHFYFDLEDDPVELTRLFKENISKTSPKNLTRHELNDLRLLLSDCDSIFSEIEF